MGQRSLTSLWLLLISHIGRRWEWAEWPFARLLEEFGDEGVSAWIFQQRIPAGIGQSRLDLRGQRFLCLG